MAESQEPQQNGVEGGGGGVGGGASGLRSCVESCPQDTVAAAKALYPVHALPRAVNFNDFCVVVVFAHTRLVLAASSAAAIAAAVVICCRCAALCCFFIGFASEASSEVPGPPTPATLCALGSARLSRVVVCLACVYVGLVIWLSSKN